MSPAASVSRLVGGFLREVVVLRTTLFHCSSTIWALSQTQDLICPQKKELVFEGSLVFNLISF